MKKNQISVGTVYQARVSGNVVLIRVEEIIERDGYSIGSLHRRATTNYRCTNLSTKREIIVKSAARLRPRPITVSATGERIKHTQTPVSHYGLTDQQDFHKSSTYVPTDAEITKAINSR